MSTAASPSQRYRDGVTAGQWQDDPAQRAVLPELDRIQQALLQADEPPDGWLARWRKPKPQLVPGLYLWGHVGRGKTFLTELLLQSLPCGLAHREHFHAFMRAVHDRLRSLGDVRDPLPRIAEQMAGRFRLLCLDEFQVIDIGDAMLLGGLLEALFERGVSLVTTSNTEPDELYRDGLQRARFEPAIELLKQHCVVHEMVSPRDWRLRALQRLPHWLVPPGPQADAKLTEAMLALSHGPIEQQVKLEINQRSILARQVAPGAAWFDFAALCEGPRAASDYLELAARFPALLVSGVPLFNPDQENAARRFVHLVDALYDHQVQILMSAMTPIVEMYDGDRLRAEFARTESRLIEMQDPDFIAKLQHRGSGTATGQRQHPDA